jgi:hypothetical protein
LNGCSETERYFLVSVQPLHVVLWSSISTILWPMSLSCGRLRCISLSCILIAFTDSWILQVVHPRYKIQWFHDAKWEEEWITTAITTARDIWTKYYKPLVTVQAPTASGNDFDDLDNYGTHTNADAFETHISSGLEPGIEDVIKHYSSKVAPAGATTRTSGNMFAQMALDFLSAPAASTDVERLFSHGGLVVSKHRHSLKAESIRASTVLQSWLALGDEVVPKQKLVKSFNGKHLRKKQIEKEKEVIGIPSSEEDEGDRDSGSGDEDDDESDEDTDDWGIGIVLWTFTPL